MYTFSLFRKFLFILLLFFGRNPAPPNGRLKHLETLQIRGQTPPISYHLSTGQPDFFQRISRCTGSGAVSLLGGSSHEW